MRSGRTSCCLGGRDGNETDPTDASKRDSVKGAGVDFVSSDDDDGRRFLASKQSSSSASS